MIDTLLVRNSKTTWINCLETIKIQVDDKSYSTWFLPISPVSLIDDVLTIQVPSQFFYEWLEEHFVYVLKSAIVSELGPMGRLEYSIIVDRGNEKNNQLSINLPTAKVQNYKPLQSNYSRQGNNPIAPLDKIPYFSNLNTTYTFENYIEGDCNRLARSAAQAVVNKPGTTSFNPLLIYSNVGLGKTHLVQAIGNKIVKENPSKKVLYITSEKFLNHYIECVRTEKLAEFGEYYKTVDVLIIDDIQFFSGKERTQEMFFNIFNVLHQAQKQIVLTSDCPAKDLQGMDERLLSRFKWGLSADLQQPDYETKLAIIHQKLESEGIKVGNDIIDYIAQNVSSNIRELEGVLVSLIAHSSLSRREIDLALTEQIVSSIVNEVSTEVTIDFIQKSVSEYFKISIEEMKSKSRKKEFVMPRQIGIFFAKNHTSLSLKTIGLHFGGRDHSTVIHSVEIVQDMMVTDKKFRAWVHDLQKKMRLKVS